jgi:hypothetical protein
MAEQKEQELEPPAEGGQDHEEEPAQESEENGGAQPCLLKLAQCYMSCYGVPA